MKRLLGYGAILLLVAMVLAVWLLRPDGPLPPIAPGQHQATTAKLKDPTLIRRGKYLARIGDCAACHTERDGEPYAGGRSLATPFGAVPAPNITPDPGTGIGDWSFEDFWRALHHGKGRQGQLLYPVFSYTSFTKVTREDALAMFAYLKSLPAVNRPNQPSGLRFPYSMRSSLLAWRALYFTPGVFEPDPARSAQWNRGAYLVQGLGHCNECHARRDSLGGIKKDQHLTGGQIPTLAWYAPDLSAKDGGGLAGWNAQDIVDLLKTGQSAKSTALGPMADVVRLSTRFMHDSDLQAVATYLLSLPPRPPASATTAFTRANHDAGARLYSENCADCHGADGRGVAGIYPPLDGNISVTEPSGINASRSVLLGGFPVATPGNPMPYSMPPFAQKLSDAEIAQVVTFIRQSWSNRADAVRPADVLKYRHMPAN